MKYLIDTHILLWYITGNKKIKQDTISIFENNNNTLYVSNASLWEIAIKVNIGKLRLNVSLTDLQKFLNDNGFLILPYDIEDLEMLVSLPFIHQDPFDRVIISQSKTKLLQLITDDKIVKKYFE